MSRKKIKQIATEAAEALVFGPPDKCYHCGKILQEEQSVIIRNDWPDYRCCGKCVNKHWKEPFFNDAISIEEAMGRVSGFENKV